MTTVKYTFESDIGRKRAVNEDRVAFIQRPDHFKLAVLADGMGGHNAGDVASEMAIEEMKKSFLQAIPQDFETLTEKKDWMFEVITDLNEKMYQYALANKSCEGMGTTLITVLIEGKHCLISHIGDSRVYNFLPDKTDLITRDHSYVNILIENGEISEEEAANHPQKNFIVKALGTEPTIEPDFYEVTLEDNAYLLICSDGLSNKLSTDEMAAIIKLSLPLSEKGKRLIQLANESGGEDNISIILLSTNDEEV